MRRIFCVAAVALAGFVVLNCDTSTPAPVFNLDAALPDTFVPVDDGGQQVSQDAGDGGTKTTFGCATVTDCETLITTPENCVTATDCVGGQCVYVAKDSDGDGHKIAGCKDTVSGTAFDGDDCDDVDPLVFPGAACSKDATGKPIVFPTGSPQGTCKAGTVSCASGQPVCAGYVLPIAKDDCATPADENCDGVVNDACPCSIQGATRPCGIDTGECVAGVETCDTTKGWGGCTAVGPKPRNCGAAKGQDFDCNGQADTAESSCLCGGKVVVGGTAKCDSGQLGICAAGTQTCTVNSADTSTAVFGACNANNVAGAADCNSALDNNCDGVSDELGATCPGNPCGGPKVNIKTGQIVQRQAVAAKQKFANGMWGCGGSNTYDNRTLACRGNDSQFVSCGALQWTKDNLGKSPTYNYWVTDQLKYAASTVGTDFRCSVSSNTGVDCGASTPMRVCVDTPDASCTLPGCNGPTSTDPLGNSCNWSGCGLDSANVNNHFGGCGGNTTAATLCCPYIIF